VGRKGALLGGVVGYVVGLFFKSLIIVLITLKVPSFSQYLIDTFIPVGGLSSPDFLRFFTVPLPFALMGAAVGALVFRSKTAGMASMPES
jgi:hypothetical protein